MKFHHWFLAFMVAILFIIGLIWVSTPPPNATGILHPEYSTMLKSGSSVVESPTVKWLAYLFGLGILGLFAFPIVLATRKKSKEVNQKVNRILLIGFSLYALAFTLLTVVYWGNYGEELTVFGGLPISTAVMIYAVSFVPVLFTVVYVTQFDKWIITPAELEQFKKIVQNRQKQNQ